MTFFTGFPEISYNFGNEYNSNAFQNLSIYVDVIDRVKENAILYTFYNVIEGTRPDQLSQMLYNTPDYYWTFYLMNDDIRLKGWPLDRDGLATLVQKKHPNTVLVTRDYFYDKFKVGDTVRGQTSNVSGVVTHTSSDLGQFTVAGNLTFTAGETIEKVGATHNTVTLFSSGSEVNAARYYKDSNGIVDIDPTVGPGSSIITVTNKEYYEEENEALKSIKVIKPSVVAEIFNAYKVGLRENV